MKLVALCSGGKDSVYALWLSLKEGHRIVRLVTMLPEREDSWMFHLPNLHLMDLFAECVGLPLTKGKTNGIKEKELEDLRKTLSKVEADGVVSGAIASTYQKNRIDKICRELNLKSIAPLWGREPAKLLREMIKAKFEIIIVSVSAYGLGKNWLGRKIDEECIRGLEKLHEKFGINISGEGGEYESLVLDAPFFKSKIEVIDARQEWNESAQRGVLIIQRAKVVPK